MAIVTTDRPDGEALRNCALSLLRAHRAALVRRIQRAFLRCLLDNGPDTSDPVRDVVPIPTGTDPRVVGAAVRALSADFKLITSTGRAKTRRPEAHARKLDVWTIYDRPAAECWLTDHPELSDPEPGPAVADPADPFADL